MPRISQPHNTYRAHREPIDTMGGFYMQYLESKLCIDSWEDLLACPCRCGRPGSHVIPVMVGCFFEEEGIPTWSTPHTSPTLPLTSHPWPPHLSPVNFRFAGPCPFNVSRRAEDDHVGLPCRLLRHPKFRTRPRFPPFKGVRPADNGRTQGLTGVSYRPLPAPWVA